MSIHPSVYHSHIHSIIAYINSHSHSYKPEQTHPSTREIAAALQVPKKLRLGMMLVTITVTCLLGLALCNPVPQRLDEYQGTVEVDEYTVLPTVREPQSQSPVPPVLEVNNTQIPLAGQSLPANQVSTDTPAPQTQPPAPHHSSSQSVSSELTQSVESQAESSQEVTSDESPEDTASEQTTSEEQSSESLPNSEDTTSEEMALTADGQQLMGNMIDEINGDTEDNSLESAENMRRSRILAFGIPLRPQLAPVAPIAMATGSPAPWPVSEPQQPPAPATAEPNDDDNSLESMECTATGDNGACVHGGQLNHIAEGDLHGPGLGLMMLEEERGELHL